MKQKIILANIEVANKKAQQYAVAKRACGNSIMLEGAMSKIRRMRSTLIDEGYGITILTTYSLLSDVLNTTKMADIVDKAKSVTTSDIISAVKTNKEFYSILDI